VEETSEDVEAERITVRVGPLEIGRIDDLIEAPEFRFPDRAAFVKAALLSFLAYKERELYSIRHGERWR
jgi:hypothetical protein